MKFLITKEERELIKKMHSMISEDTSAEVKSMVNQITSQVDALENKFAQIESMSGKDCVELKKSIVLAWSISSVMIKKVATALLSLITEQDILVRMKTASGAAEDLTNVVNAFNSLADEATKK